MCDIADLFYMPLQMREIEEHKYFLSEKAGFDVGYEVTLHDWVNSGQAEQFAIKYKNHINNVIDYCESECHGECKGINKCTMPIHKVHEILEDYI